MQTIHLCVLIHIRTKGEVGTDKHVYAIQWFVLLTTPRRCVFCGSFLLFMFHVYLCNDALSVPCSLVITCWDRADLLALLYVVFSCISVTYPYGVI